MKLLSWFQSQGKSWKPISSKLSSPSLHSRQNIPQLPNSRLNKIASFLPKSQKLKYLESIMFLSHSSSWTTIYVHLLCIQYPCIGFNWMIQFNLYHYLLRLSSKIGTTIWLMRSEGPENLSNLLEIDRAKIWTQFLLIPKLESVPGWLSISFSKMN